MLPLATMRQPHTAAGARDGYATHRQRPEREAAERFWRVYGSLGGYGRARLADLERRIRRLEADRG